MRMLGAGAPIMTQLGRDIVVIGASAGGVPALQRLVGALPANFPAAVFVVQHMSSEVKTVLPSILKRATPLPVLEAVDGDPIGRGKIYVAPPDHHLFVEPERMMVLRGPRENRFRPAINPLFRSAALAYRHRVVGVILTGFLDDGAAGLWAIKRCGGIAVVQSDAEFPDMPKAALENVEIDYHLPLAEIGPLLARLSREPVAVPATQAEAPEIVRLNDEAMKMRETSINLDGVGRRSVFSCPECNGALWEIDEGQMRYRCHVGHAYSSNVLRAAQHANIEQSLWTALRALRESAALDGRLAQRAQEAGLTAAAVAYRKNEDDKTVQAAQLQQFLSELEPAS